MMRLVLCALVVIALAGRGAEACDVLPDQSYEGPAKDDVLVLFEDVVAAQSFTPSIPGILDLVSIYMTHGGNMVLTAEIRAAESGLPVGPALATSVLYFPPSGDDYFPEWVVFDFLPENFHVTEGVQLAVVLILDALPPWTYSPLIAVSPFGDPYSGGIFSSSILGEPFFPSADYDALFRTTVCTGSVAVESESWGGLKALHR